MRPGIVNGNDPMVIYVTMVRRVERYPEDSKMAKLCTFRVKFNDLLNEAVGRKGNYVLSVRSCTNPSNFNHWGTLSMQGKEVFWQEIDQLIEKFENDKVKLEPRGNKKSGQFYRGPGNQ